MGKGSNNMNDDMKVNSISDDKKINIAEFPSNSKAQKEDTSEKKVKKVITGKVITRKKPLSTKFAEIVMGEGNDMHSVIGYVLNDVLIPNAKSTISDMVSSGIEMLFFGTTGGKRNRSSGGRDRTRTSYSNYYKDDYRDRDRNRDRDKDRDRDAGRNRAKHNFDDIVIETRGEAEEVLGDLMDLIDQYGVVSVADFYAMVDMTSNFTEQDYGWENLTTQNTRIERVRQGFVIHLPRPKSIK
jgi:hypothetical protein